MIVTSTIQTQRWKAEIIISDSVDVNENIYHVYAITEGNSEPDAAEAAEWVQVMFAGGRPACVRVSPETASERDFDTEQIKHRGFVRFSVVIENDVVAVPVIKNDLNKIPSIGELSVKA